MLPFALAGDSFEEGQAMLASVSYKLRKLTNAKAHSFTKRVALRFRNVGNTKRYMKWQYRGCSMEPQYFV
ncbi:MAG: hypothetical protein ACI8WT_004894 [Clostridium sp.]|jgi:hypothetical protein